MQTLNYFYVMIMMLVPLAMSAQDVKLSFDNPEITYDGSNHYYEVDVMIASQTAAGAFYLSSGQFYLNYNEQAFGSNIHGSGNVELSLPSNDYLLNLKDSKVEQVKVYSTAMTNDNAPNRFSASWQQDRAGNCISKMVSATPTPLLHLKIKYADSNISPDICFETSALYTGQIYTACGEMNGPCDLGGSDCSSFPGLSVADDFDCTGASLCASFAVNAGGTRNSCMGALISLGGVPTATGGSGTYTYEWFPTNGLSDATVANPEITVTGSASYSVNVSDGSGCVLSETVVINALELPTVAYDATPASGANVTDGSILLNISGGQAPYTTTWNDGATTPNRSDLAPGIYDVDVVDTNGCSLSISIVVGTEITSGVVDPTTWIQSVSLYPNPAYRDITMELNSIKTAPVVFQIVDELGRVLQEVPGNIQLGANIFTLSTTSLSNGSYFLQIKEGKNDPIFVRPFVKLKK